MKLKPFSSKLLAALAAIIAAVAMAHAADDSMFAGLKGREIAELINREFRPETYVADDRAAAAIVEKYAACSTGGFRDYFSNERPTTMNSLRMVRVVNPSWWGPDFALYTCVSYDLHNILPGNYDAEAIRGEYPPGPVDKATYDNGVWRLGDGHTPMMSACFFEPCESLKGDIARIYMYMSVVYPTPLWQGLAFITMADGGYPYLSVISRDVLMAWHRLDPPDADELRRDEALAQAQGIGNPFVTIPELAEYIWGRHADEIYRPSAEPDPEPEPNPDPDPDPEPEPDPDEHEPIMLKPSYSIEHDRFLDFRSPYVDADAVWTIDGKAVDARFIRLADVAVGRHELRYHTATTRGKVIITVTP